MGTQIQRINDFLPATLRGDYRAFQYMDAGGKWHIRMGRDLNTVHEDTVQESIIFGGLHMVDSDKVTLIKSCINADKRTYEYGDFLAFGLECREHFETFGRNSAGFNEPLFGTKGPELIIGGRTTHDDFFVKCPSFQSKSNKHFPFLVFEVDSSSVEVKMVYDPTLLLPYPASTRVMVQWQGKWSSDYFSFTVGELVQYMSANTLSDAELGTPEFGQQYKVPEQVIR